MEFPSIQADSPQAQDLKQLRRRYRMTQETLESLSGVPQATISAIENGHSKPSLDTLAKIASAITVHEILLNQYPEVLKDPRGHEAQVRHLDALSGALLDFLQARPEYVDLVEQVVVSLATIRARLAE